MNGTEPDPDEVGALIALQAASLADGWAAIEAQLQRDLAACRARIADIEAGIVADRARPHLTVVSS